MPADDQARQRTTAARRRPQAAPRRAVEGAGTLEFRARPCGGEPVCPWRRDADLTTYTDEDMYRLIEASQGDTSGGAYSQADADRMFSARRMACHLYQPGTAHPLRLCAGWLAVVGPHHYRARLALARRAAQLAALGPAEPTDVGGADPAAVPGGQPRVEPRS